MYPNGYIMVDCTGLDLTKGETPQTIAGLYDKVQNAIKSGKPIYAANCNWDNAPVTPIQTFAINIAEDTVVCTASTLQVWVTEEDVVTIANMVA